MSELFIIDAANAVRVLEDFHKRINDLKEEEISLFITTVHGMKSTLANIGEKELSGAALNLEKAGDERNIAEIIQAAPEFTASLRSLIEKHKQEKKENPEVSADDLNYLREKLNNIKTSCAAFDKNTAKAELQELKQKTWPQDANTLLDEIAINILHSAFKKAADIIEDYLR